MRKAIFSDSEFFGKDLNHKHFSMWSRRFSFFKSQQLIFATTVAVEPRVNASEPKSDGQQTMQELSLSDC
jgi:hypothetical protein